MSNDKRWIHGRAVDPQTKALRFVSVSAIQSGDPKSGGCTRKWVYEKIYGKKPPPSPWQEEGAQNHAQVANYLVTGERNISQQIAKGMHLLPTPGQDLLVEWDLLKRPGVAYPQTLTDAHSPQLLADAPVKIAGVPLLGSIDCAHARGINYGTEDITVTQDPDGTVEVCDWKFVSSVKYLKDANDLHQDTQLSLYARWVYEVRPHTPIVRVSLGYFPKNGNPRKVSALVSREKIAPQVEHAEGVVRLLADAARCTDIEDVDANLAACDNYGGCHHKVAGYCTAPKRKSLAGLVGQTAADSAYGIQSQGVIPVASLLHRANQNAGQPATAPTTPAPAQGGSLLNPGGTLLTPPPPPTPPAQVAPTPEQIAAEQARIAEAERLAYIKSLCTPDFTADCAKIREWNRGFPGLRGNAAQVFAMVGGQAVAPGAVFPGVGGAAGNISHVWLDEPQQLKILINDLTVNFGPPPTAAPPAPAASLLAPNTPAMDPNLAVANPELRQAALGMNTVTDAYTATQTTIPGMIAGGGVTGTTTVIENPPVTMTQTVPVETGTPVTAGTETIAPTPASTESPKKKRGPKPKAAPVDGEAPAVAESGIHLYIDVATTIETESLNDWAQEQADKLAQKFGAIDVRCAPEDGPLGYEKWRGALAAWIRDEKASPLAPGRYSIDTRYSAVMTIIAEALSIRARTTGGTVTRSVR